MLRALALAPRGAPRGVLCGHLQHITNASETSVSRKSARLMSTGMPSNAELAKVRRDFMLVRALAVAAPLAPAAGSAKFGVLGCADWASWRQQRTSGRRV